MLPKASQDEEPSDTSDRTQRLIVKFKPIPPDSDTTLASIVEEVQRAIPNGELLRPPRASGRALFAVESDVDVAQLAEELSLRDDIEYAEADVADRATMTPEDNPLNPAQSHRNDSPYQDC